MISRSAAATALCLTLGLSPVFAGTTSGTVGGASGTAATAGAGGAAVSPVQRQQPGQWLADDLVGTKVHNAQDQHIGEVEDLLFGPDGKIVAVVVGVGGFLGIGEREVAIPWEQFRMMPVDQLHRRADANRTDANRAREPTALGPTTGTGATTTTAPAGTAADRPRVPAMRLVVDATRDQLRSMPAFVSLDDQNRRDAAGTRPADNTATGATTRPAAGADGTAGTGRTQ